MIRILLADDQALVRAGFRLILNAEPDLEVVAEAGDGDDAVEQALEKNPDVALTMLWVLLTSIVLVRRGERAPGVAPSYSVASS